MPAISRTKPTVLSSNVRWGIGNLTQRDGVRTSTPAICSQTYRLWSAPTSAGRLVARQLAFKETGEQATANEVAAHLKEHRARLILEAEKLIATSSSFKDWRFPRRPSP